MQHGSFTFKNRKIQSSVDTENQLPNNKGFMTNFRGLNQDLNRKLYGSSHVNGYFKLTNTLGFPNNWTPNSLHIVGFLALEI